MCLASSQMMEVNAPPPRNRSGLLTPDQGSAEPNFHSEVARSGRLALLEVVVFPQTPVLFGQMSQLSLQRPTGSFPHTRHSPQPLMSPTSTGKPGISTPIWLSFR